MIATLAFLEEKFKVLNDLCFKGLLPTPTLRLCNVTTFLGCVRFRSSREPPVDSRYKLVVICLNTKYDLPEEELEDVILHEMIHYYLLCKHHFEDKPHGKEFKRIMNLINERHGRHITVSHKVLKNAKELDTERRCHDLLLLDLVDGKFGICHPTYSHFQAAVEKLSMHPDVKKLTYYQSYDPFFNRFKRTYSYKVYLITAEEIAAHLNDDDLRKVYQK